MKRLLFAITLLLWSATAQAIPVAGTYVFAPDDPNISGTFTSTGTSLSAWAFESDLFGVSTSVLPPAAWNSATDLSTSINNADLFSSSMRYGPHEEEGYWGTLRWSPDPSNLNGTFRIDALCCDHMYLDGPPTVTFALADNGRLAVPEPNTLWLVGGGLVGLLFFVRRLQSRRDAA